MPNRRNNRNRRRKAASIIMLMIMFDWCRRTPNRSSWVEHYVARRRQQGLHGNLFMELRMEKPDKYRKCLRMTPEMFDWLADKVRPIIQKQDTHLRRAIAVEERLSVTLRHFATGETQESLAAQYRLGQSTVSGILKETTKAIYTVLKDTYLKFPSTEEEWRNIAHEFEDRWNFANCIGAMDGKHVLIRPPSDSGSLFYNYKETFSVVLLAVVDAQLRFIYADVGTNGRVNDKAVWNKCSLKKALEEGTLNVPRPTPLPGIAAPFPYIIVGDEGFTLSTKVLLPHPKEHVRGRRDRKIFNYRLSRARRCSENAFGVMVNRFQIFLPPMRYDPDDARDIVLAVLCLHNLLRSDTLGRSLYSPPTMLDCEDEVTGQIQRGEHRRVRANGLRPFCQGGNRHGNDAIALRQEWTDYFNGVGAVPWQERMITA